MLPRAFFPVLAVTLSTLAACSADVQVAGNQGSSSAASASAGAGAGGGTTSAASSSAGAGAGGACPGASGHVLGGPGPQIARSLAIDSQGAAVMTLQHPGDLTIDGVGLMIAPDAGYMVMKLDAKGALAWSRAFGASPNNEYLPVVVDGDDDVIVGGSFSGKIDLGEGVVAEAPGHAAFVAKLDAAGHPLWARGFPDGYSGADLMNLAVDGDGNIFLTGALDPGESIQLGGAEVTGDFFLVELDPDGHPLWGKGFTGLAPEQATMATTSSGHVILGGSFSASVDFGGGPLTSAGDFDVFLVELDGHGEHVWSRRFGDANYQRASTLRLDAAGDIVLSGYFSTTIDLGGGPLTAPPGPSTFLAKLTPTGEHIWSRGFPGADSAMLMAVSTSGEVTLASTGFGFFDAGCGKITFDASEGRAFVARLDSAGACVWQRGFGAGESQIVNDVAAGTDGRVTVIGDFVGTIDVGGGPVQSGDDIDAFVVTVDGPCAP